MTALDPNALPLRGPHLIEASAGTGKTHTISSLFVRLVLERSLPVGQILVLTYTRAATAELRDRIRRRLSQTLTALEGGTPGDQTLRGLVERCEAAGTLDEDLRKVRRALREFDEAAILTIHGFCQRVLGEQAFGSGVDFELELVEDQSPLLDEISVDYFVRTYADAPPPLVRYAKTHGAALQRLRGLVGKLAQRPSARTLPVTAPRVVPADVEQARERWAEARSTVLETWRSQRGELLALLCAGALHRRSFNPELIRERWAPSLDALDTLPPGELPDFVDRLTPAALRSRTLKGKTTPQHPFFDQVETLLKAHQELAALLAAQTLALRLEATRYARRELAERKRRRGQQGFDDLLASLHQALSSDHGRRLAAYLTTAYPAALVDEFQDTDAVQYEILMRLYGREGSSLFLIGDPKQAIYAFRGADVFSYLAAARHPGLSGRRHTLDVNWRSDPALVGAVNTLFQRVRKPFVFDGIDYKAVRTPAEATERLRGSYGGGALELLWLPRDERTLRGRSKVIAKGHAEPMLVSGVAAEVARLLDSDLTIDGEAVRPRDVAVLCRTNAQARGVQGALRSYGIPSALEGDNSVFQSEMAEELERVLSAMAEPGDARRVRAALSTSVFGYDGGGLHRLTEDEQGWDRCSQRFYALNETWNAHGFVQAFRRMLDDAGAEQRLLLRPDGERRLTDLLHLGELLHRAAFDLHLGPLSLLHHLESLRSGAVSPGNVAGESAQVRLESDEHALRLTTIHKAKGLEYPIVFCPFLWDGTLLRPDEAQEPCFHQATDQGLVLDLGSDQLQAHRELAEREALGESLRLLYVALTRARHRCFVVCGGFNRYERSALAFVLHQGATPPQEDPVEEVAARVPALDDAGLLQDLTRLCEASGGAVAVRELSLRPGPAYRRASEPPVALEARGARRVHDGRFRVSSFTGLTAAEHAGDELQREQGADHDAQVAQDSPQHAAAPSGTRIPLESFPQGATPGTLIHDILEQIDFVRADPEQLQNQAALALERYGLEEQWCEPLAAALYGVLHTSLGHGGPALAQVAAHERLSELEFTLPVHGQLISAALARAFGNSPGPAAAGGYPQRIANLGFAPLQGFLKGFVDLVFRHQGRFYLVDYKSNHLGPQFDDYAAPQLRGAMGAHHYYLQYHLYAVALCRYLRGRLPDFDYERDFGGVYYLFLRGMAPEHGCNYGVFFDRPAVALMTALEALLDGRSAT